VFPSIVAQFVKPFFNVGQFIRAAEGVATAQRIKPSDVITFAAMSVFAAWATIKNCKLATVAGSDFYDTCHFSFPLVVVVVVVSYVYIITSAFVESIP
jgi:hypothetical protein